MTQFFKKFQPNIKNEVLSGITVALALVPEAVAFSIIAGVDPIVGLYAAFSIGIVTSIFGGRPGMISGATGAIAVVIVSLVKDHGEEHLFAAVILMGLIQMLIGALKLGKFIRMVPQAVMYGFVNGLAVVIFMSQLAQFQVADADGVLQWMQGQDLLFMLGLTGATIGLIYLIPKVTKVVPAALASILIVSCVVILGGINTRTVGDLASISAGLPTFSIPNVSFSWETLKIIFPYSIIMALVGLIESLLTLNLIDEITETRGRGNKECVAQGAANIFTGFLGGMGGCAMIGQSLININSGARQRLSGIVAAVGLLVFILFGSSLIEQVPMAALTGLMIVVSVGTFEWASLRIFGKFPLSDVIVMIIVTLVTVFLHNLALAVFIGVIISALAFAWENSKRIRARKYVDDKGVKHYEIYGPLFFGSTQTFQTKFDVQEDPDTIIVDFKESRIADHSAIEALNALTARYSKIGKTVKLRHLSPDCKSLLQIADSLIEINIEEDPKYKVAIDALA